MLWEKKHCYSLLQKPTTFAPNTHSAPGWLTECVMDALSHEYLCLCENTFASTIALPSPHPPPHTHQSLPIALRM